MAKKSFFVDIDWLMVLYFGLFLLSSQLFMSWLGLTPSNLLARYVVECFRVLVGFSLARLLFKKKVK